MRRWAVPLPLAASLALACAAPRPAAAQEIPESAYRAVAGCWTVEPMGAAPWLAAVDARLLLTLEPVEGMSESPQLLVRPGSDPTGLAAGFPFAAWSLFADGLVVSIVWSSESDQIALMFEPEREPAVRPAVGTTTYFRHETMETTEPVGVRVTRTSC